MRLAIALATCLAAGPAAAGACKATSGAQTAALVELYTSEGCSSCPPADRWLSTLGERGYAPGRVVPLSLHVDYWDYIGWKDPYGKREFSLRQRKLTQLQRMALVYTPQVMLQGRDFQAWGSSAFEREVGRINALPARARLAIEIHALKEGRIDAQADAQLLDAAQQADAVLYLATYENRLTSKVAAGENSGRVLQHDYVVLEWQGPYAFGADGRLSERRTLALLPKGVAANSGVVGFVQNRRTGEVLQALMLPAC